jgi:hypothetical protein
MSNDKILDILSKELGATFSGMKDIICAIFRSGYRHANEKYYSELLRLRKIEEEYEELRFRMDGLEK